MARNKKSKKAKGKTEKAKGKSKKSKSKGTGGQRVLSGSLALTKMKHVILKMKGKKKKKIELIAFPIDANFFVRGKDKAIYMPVRAIVKDEEDEHGQHGFIAQSTDSKAWKAANEELQAKMRDLPILGGLKDFAFDGGNDSSGAMSDDTFDPDEDDLPF